MSKPVMFSVVTGDVVYALTPESFNAHLKLTQYVADPIDSSDQEQLRAALDGCFAFLDERSLTAVHLMRFAEDATARIFSGYVGDLWARAVDMLDVHDVHASLLPLPNFFPNEACPDPNFVLLERYEASGWNAPGKRDRFMAALEGGMIDLP